MIRYEYTPKKKPSQPEQVTILIFVSQDMWLAKTNDPKAIASYGVPGSKHVVIPTPYMATSSADAVLANLRHLNPKAIVELDPDNGYTELVREAC